MKKILNVICKLAGHNWHYKDYSNWMKENGDSYDFKASRYCSRCNQIEYLYSNWIAESTKNKYDIERDVYSLKHPPVYLKGKENKVEV